MVQSQQQQQFQPPGIRPHYRPQVQPQYARQNNQVRDSNNYPTANNNYRVRNQHSNQTHRSNQQQNGDYFFYFDFGLLDHFSNIKNRHQPRSTTIW